MTDIMQKPTETEAQRIDKALSLIVAYGGIDGAHHKDWVIDQVTRALTGCPAVEVQAFDYKERPYTYFEQVPNEAYSKFVADACKGKDGPNTYSWEEGIAP